MIAEASVLTDRAGRYLGQLCQHLEHIAQAHPQAPVRVEWRGVAGRISLGTATCALRADEHALNLRAEAPDDASLQEIQRRIAERLEQIGRRDGLTVSWITVRDEASSMAEPWRPADGSSPYEEQPRSGLPRWVRIVVIVLGVLALLVVVGILIGGGHQGPSRHF